MVTPIFKMPDDKDTKHIEDTEVSASGPGATVRIPAFWRADPQLWFCQADAVFATSKITSSRIKFQIVVANLEFEILTQVSDLVKNPPQEPYEALKDRLVSTYAESENQRIKRLLEDRRLADGERPSHFLNELKRLAGCSISSDLLRTIWSKALPERMQATLAVTTETSVDKLAEIADRIAEVYEPSISQVNSHTTTSHSAPTSISQLEEMIRKMSLQISELQTQMARGRGSRSSDRGRSRSRSKGRQFCYYHHRFREKARKCQQPCSWKHTTTTPKGN